MVRGIRRVGVNVHPWKQRHESACCTGAIAKNPHLLRRWSPLKSLLFCSMLVLLSCIVYAQVARNQFVSYDDHKYIYDSLVRNGLSVDGFRYAFTAAVDANWIPLTLLSHMLDTELFGTSPAGTHGVNLFFHCLNAVILWLLLRRITGADGRSAVVALIFALHPLRVESVAWAAERKDVLSSLFWLLALHAYVGYVQRRGILRYLLIVALLTAGLLAKPMLVTLPITLLLLDYWPLGQLQIAVGCRPLAWKRLIAEKLPLLVPVIAVAVVTVSVQDRGGALNAYVTGSLYDNVANAAVSLVVYLRQFIYPTGLAFFYPAEKWPLVQWTGALLILVSITLAVFRRPHRRYLIFGWLWYLVTILPVIGLVRVGTHAHADRYTYIPLLGITILVVWLVADLCEDLPQGKWAVLATTILVVGLCAVVSYRQVGYWKDSFTLYNRALAVTRNNWLAHNNLAVLYVQWGQLAEVEQHLAAALRIRPDYDDALINLGQLRTIQKRPGEALEAFRLAVEVNPRSVNALYRLGVSLVNQGMLAEGKRIAIQLTPLDHSLAESLDGMLSNAAASKHYKESPAP